MSSLPRATAGSATQAPVKNPDSGSAEPPVMSQARVLVLGSINIDDVFSVSGFVQPGETIACKSYARHIGGKGDNQAVALARAGAQVAMAGKIGEDGRFILDALGKAGVDHTRVAISSCATGRAIIQVRDDGQNCILLAPGANRDIDPSYVDSVLEGAEPGDMIVFQNEISSMEYALGAAAGRGLTVVFNPSPITDELASLPLHLVDWLVLNETEGQLLSGASEPFAILSALGLRYPHSSIVLTLGADGVLCRTSGGKDYRCPARQVPVVDTTAAGDTFTGYFLAAILAGSTVQAALESGTAAGALCVGRAGAQPSIPMSGEVRDFMAAL